MESSTTSLTSPYRPSSMRRVVIIGSGIAGVEAALALAIAHPTAHVTMVSRELDLSIVPDLVYTPFGIDPTLLRIPLQRALASHGVEFVVGIVRRIDVDSHEVELAAGRTLRYDSLVVATGAHAATPATNQLRTIADGHRLYGELLPFSRPELRRRSIMITLTDASPWPAPAFELALLLDRWLTACGTRDRVDVVVAHPDREPLSIFGPEASDLLTDRAVARRIELIECLVAGSADGMSADLVIDMPALVATHLQGLPHLDPDGLHAVDDQFAIAPDVFVIGDANTLRVKTGFAAAWQARRLALQLGARPELLGSSIDGVSIDDVVYEMDLIDGTLVARFHAASRLRPPYIDRHVDAQIVQRLPRKLAGTLIREYLLDDLDVDAGASVRAFQRLVAGEPEQRLA